MIVYVRHGSRALTAIERHKLQTRKRRQRVNYAAELLRQSGPELGQALIEVERRLGPLDRRAQPRRGRRATDR